MSNIRKLLSLFLILPGVIANAQQTSDSTSHKLDLNQCIQYAYNNSPLLKKSTLDEEITDHAIKSKIADWYPQIRFDYTLQHAFQLQVSNINGNLIPLGLKNTSSGQFGITQNIFNTDALLASSSANVVRKQAAQNTIANKIDLTVNVGKAYYDVLLTLEQMKVLDENIIRLNQSLQDAYNQYEGGIVDKVDYKRATISLNNSQAERKTAEEVLKAKYAFLKLQMGYPDTAVLRLVIVDNKSDLQTLAIADTSANLAIDNRIEIQQLQTQKKLQELNYNYYKWQFIPTVQAYGNYNLNYLNSDFGDLYKDNYPNSFAGIRVGVPLFQGFKRTQNMKQAKLQSDRVNYDLDEMKLQINSEVAQSLATYKGHLNDYYSLKENVDLAQDIFNTIELQYKSGVKTYLEVITAQSDLRSAQLNYNNALYQLLGSKLDLEKALGTVVVY